MWSWSGMAETCTLHIGLLWWTFVPSYFNITTVTYEVDTNKKHLNSKCILDSETCALPITMLWWIFNYFKLPEAVQEIWYNFRQMAGCRDKQIEQTDTNISPIFILRGIYIMHLGIFLNSLNKDIIVLNCYYNIIYHKVPVTDKNQLHKLQDNNKSLLNY